MPSPKTPTTPTTKMDTSSKLSFLILCIKHSSTRLTVDYDAVRNEIEGCATRDAAYWRHFRIMREFGLSVNGAKYGSGKKGGNTTAAGKKVKVEDGGGGGTAGATGGKKKRSAAAADEDEDGAGTRQKRKRGRKMTTTTDDHDEDEEEVKIKPEIPGEDENSIEDFLAPEGGWGGGDWSMNPGYGVSDGEDVDRHGELMGYGNGDTV